MVLEVERPQTLQLNKSGWSVVFAWDESALSIFTDRGQLGLKRTYGIEIVQTWNVEDNMREVM